MFSLRRNLGIAIAAALLRQEAWLWFGSYNVALLPEFFSVSRNQDLLLLKHCPPFPFAAFFPFGFSPPASLWSSRGRPCVTGVYSWVPCSRNWNQPGRLLPTLRIRRSICYQFCAFLSLFPCSNYLYVLPGLPQWWLTSGFLLVSNRS